MSEYNHGVGPDFGKHQDLAAKYADDVTKYLPRFPTDSSRARFIETLNNLYEVRLSRREPHRSSPYAHTELMEQAELMHQQRRTDPHWNPGTSKW